MRVLLVIAACLGIAACGDLPRDPDGTLQRVGKERLIRLGHVAGAPRDPAAEAVLRRLAMRMGAQLRRSDGHGEELLEALEEGELDLVYGRFADDSPWATAVHFGTPPAGPRHPPKSQRVARFAFRNGENGWIAAVEDAGR